MDDVTLLFDVVLPVLHEVLQRYQWVFNYWHHIFRGPGLHGNQHDPCVQLFLVDLGTKKMPISLLLSWHGTFAANTVHGEPGAIRDRLFPNVERSSDTRTF